MPTTLPEGYFALPASGKGDPVLVLHAWWGLNESIRELCRRLANEGFVAFAPDIYHGKVTDQIAEAEELIGSMDENYQQARAEVKAAASFLKDYAGSGASGIAVIGFSMGAFYALDLSINAPDAIDSVVTFYGTGATDFSQSKARYLAHFAQNDPYEPQSNIDEIEEGLKSAGRPAAFYMYPGTGHWFFEPDRTDAYNEEAANLAWDRTLEFLKRSNK